MKKLCSIALAFLCVFLLCGAAAPQASYKVTGTNMVIKFPEDYVIYGQDGVLSSNGGAIGWSEEQIDALLDYMKDNQTLLYATQIDEYDEIYIDSDSFADSRSMKDFTKFCEAHSEMDDKELLSKLEEATYFRGPESVVENYTSKSMEVVTINGEKYGYAVGVFDNDDKEGYVLEYDTVKNGKAIRLEMYTTGEPHEDQIDTFRGIMKTIGYTRGASGFPSQYILGTNGAALIPWIIFGIVVIAAIIILIIILHRWRKKHPKQKQAAAQENGWPNATQNAYQSPITYGEPYKTAEPPQTGAWKQAPVRQTPYQTPPGAAPGYGQNAVPQAQPMPQTGQQSAPDSQPYTPVSQPDPQTQTAVGQTEDMPVNRSAQTAVPQTSDPAATAPAGGQVDIMEMLEKLSELKRQGILTPEEYEYKKNELLRRL